MHHGCITLPVNTSLPGLVMRTGIMRTGIIAVYYTTNICTMQIKRQGYPVTGYYRGPDGPGGSLPVSLVNSQVLWLSVFNHKTSGLKAGDFLGNIPAKTVRDHLIQTHFLQAVSVSGFLNEANRVRFGKFP